MDKYGVPRLDRQTVVVSIPWERLQLLPVGREQNHQPIPLLLAESFWLKGFLQKPCQARPNRPEEKISSLEINQFPRPDLSRSIKTVTHQPNRSSQARSPPERSLQLVMQCLEKLCLNKKYAVGIALEGPEIFLTPPEQANRIVEGRFSCREKD